jgi:protein-S-isoprenylcysteine O-methyltransferase Ste14
MALVHDHAHVIAPPPLILAAAALAGMVLRHVWPMSFWPGNHVRAPAMVCFAAAISLAGAALGRFWHVRTTVMPHHNTTALVTTGVFRFTRNPLYFSLGLLLLGTAFALNSLAMLVMIGPWAVVMRYGVIAREERYLERKFGDDYRSYCCRVNRWL